MDVVYVDNDTRNLSRVRAERNELNQLYTFLAFSNRLSVRNDRKRSAPELCYTFSRKRLLLLGGSSSAKRKLSFGSGLMNRLGTWTSFSYRKNWNKKESVRSGKHNFPSCAFSARDTAKRGFFFFSFVNFSDRYVQRESKEKKKKKP